MSNLCSFGMKVKGKKPEDVKEFVRILMNEDYELLHPDKLSNKHFWRIDTLGTIVSYSDDNLLADISGCCAWSVYSCMFDGPFTYQQDYKGIEGNTGTTIPEVSKELGLDIEIFSEECGMEFMEHFLVKNGNIVIKDCVDYERWDLDDYETFEEIAADYAKLPFGKDEFIKAKAEDNFIEIGGIPWEYQIA